MNLGQAVALCLYELARDPKAATARPDRIRRAAAGETEQITRLLMEALERSGYVNPVTGVSPRRRSAAWSAAWTSPAATPRF